MYPAIKTTLRRRSVPLSKFSSLIDRCISLKSSDYSRSVHALLVKTGFNCHTFLGNRCLDLYTSFAGSDDVLKVFEDITCKNVFSWNIFLRALIQCGELKKACQVFDNMPERDAVSWNSMISGFAAHGYLNGSLKLFIDMQKSGLKPTVYTFSTLVSVVRSPIHGKQIHGYAAVSGTLVSSGVLANSLIAMYGRFGLVGYAFGLFSTVEVWDIITWNSWIYACHRSGCWETALEQFRLMRYLGHSPDSFTLSTVIAVCADSYDLIKGKQIFTLCTKMGFLSNTIVSSAAIDLFSSCGSLEDSVGVFLNIDNWNSSVCDSMISSYVRHGFADDALNLFVLALRQNIIPTEFTISSVVCAASFLFPLMPGLQLHCLAVKLRVDSDSIVATSLVDMYAKYGMAESSLKLFSEIDVKDLFCRNSMIFGLARNGRIVEALCVFTETLGELGFTPNAITFFGVLLACYLGGLTKEGICIFLAMRHYGLIPRDEHYECVVGLLSRAGQLKEAIDLVEVMPHQPSIFVLRSLFWGVKADEDLKLIERISYKMMEMEPHSSLPYLVLSHAYEIRGRWESTVRVRKAMVEIGVKKVSGYSWIGVKNIGYSFESNQLLHYGGQDTYSILQLLMWDMKDGATCDISLLGET